MLLSRLATGLAKKEEEGTMVAIRKKTGKGGKVYEPTPRDIRRTCEQIQATWSPRECVKRTGRPRATWWTPPNIPVSSIAEAVYDERSDSPLC